MTGRSWWRSVPVLLGVLLLVGCDLFGGPGGPGTLTARVSASGAEVGAAVLQVSGAGVTGFSGAGTSQVFSRSTDGSHTYRVVVVNPHPGPLAFRIDVEDLAAPAPVVRVASAADASDELLPPDAGARVTVGR